MLIFFEPAGMCTLQTDLVLAPLPAKKQLWEAGDEFRWQAECESEGGVETIFALAANGDLVKVDVCELHRNDTILVHRPLDGRKRSGITGNWEEWCSGIDGFGNLIMLAASLLG